MRDQAPPAATTEDSVIRRSVLGNGIVVVTEEMPHVRTAAFAVMTRQGSRDERPKDNGLSHFLEHFIFRGTKPWARCPSGRNIRDVSIESDLLGGELDAWTAREGTCYSAEVAADLFPRAASLVMDMVARPSLPERDLERERAVIREEIRGYDEDPTDRAFMHAAAAYWPRHPLGRRVEGTVKTLASFTIEDIERFWQQKHAGANILCCASGRIAHEDVVALATESLGSLPAPAPKNGPASRAPVRALKLERRARLEQAQVVLSIPALPARHPALPALGVLVTALGGGMSSRLWQRIREEEGLAYQLALDNETFRDCGRVIFHAACAPENAARVLRAFHEEAAALRMTALPAEEFERVITSLRSGVVLDTETAGDRLGDLAWGELVHGRPVTLDERLKRLAEVTPEHVREIAAEVFSDPRRGLVVVSPDVASLGEDVVGPP